MDPQGTLSFMEGHICVSMDPQPNLETLLLWVLCLFGRRSRSPDPDNGLIVFVSRDNMSSSETTQILFNSPALHSLKRDQLVKLCKLHSIKATGKNAELIQKLKHHAATLPLGSPLSVATRSEQPLVFAGSPPQRPSEQWEIVMEDIPELPGGMPQSTLSSIRSVASNEPDEFGTGAGSKREHLSILAIFDLTVSLQLPA